MELDPASLKTLAALQRQPHEHSMGCWEKPSEPAELAAGGALGRAHAPPPGDNARKRSLQIPEAHRQNGFRAHPGGARYRTFLAARTSLKPA
jgi:hypothetical protein